jgi:hypothetical protein
MKPLTTTVIVFEENRTRAELYDLWLEEFDVRIAVTKRQADEKLDGNVAVAVLDLDFADAKTLVEIIRKRAPVCRVITTRDRSADAPDLDVAKQVVKPVFRDELDELVTRLLRRANYHLALRLYYRATVTLSHAELDTPETDIGDEETRRLQRRVSRLQTLVRALKSEMNQEDLIAVKQSLDFENPRHHEQAPSRYRPDKCSTCGADWDGTGEQPPVKRLGAYVWRCTECGHTQMRTGPSRQEFGSYRR